MCANQQRGVPVGEIQHIAGLIARARQGQGEFLSGPELVALMPFAAR
jgi:hypothetical protein